MLKSEKKVIGSLNKCYSIAEITENNERYLLCAAEKEDPCYRFDLEGNKLETLWKQPGGVMSMEQYGNALLATWKFYSPNNSAEAKIVYYIHENDQWTCHVLCDLPFVHRFGILREKDHSYLVACTLKSAHAFKDDWTCPGRIWVAELPEDITCFDQDHQLELMPLVSGLYRNHGFCKVLDEEHQYALVGTENGIFKVTVPHDGQNWAYENVLEVPASDMLYIDFDQDGEKEMLVLSPFHGDTLSIYRNKEKVWEYPEKLPFLHAIYAGTLSKPYAFIGNRQGNRNLLAVSWDPEKNTYTTDLLDQGAGAANCYFLENNGKALLMAANRETDEIALYELKED